MSFLEGSETALAGCPGRPEQVVKRTLEHARRNTDIHEHLLTLFNLVKNMKAKLVIELGVNTAESTVALLEGVRETDGKLVSVDIQQLPRCIEMLKGYGLTDRWEFHVANDLA